MELLGAVSLVELTCFPLGDMLVSVQDRCTVCAKRTIGSEIILDAPDGTTSDVGDVESLFFLFGDCVSIGAS